MMRSALLCLAVASLALAGCSSPSGHSANNSSSHPDDGLAPTATTGILRGVIVDPAIRPLGNVTVVASGQGAEQTTQSAVDGSFGFQGLAPGTWFLTASKPGYTQVQQSANVVAGDANPPLVKMLLQEDAATRPYEETYVWHGFIDCSAGVPVAQASVNPCFLTPTSSNTWALNLSGVPQVAQAEMVWHPGSAVGSSFLISGFVPNDDPTDADGVTDYQTSQGRSPLILRMAGDELAANKVGTDFPLALRVFPGEDQPTAFVEQAFDVYITLFYGYEPPTGWSLGADGDYPPPA